MSRKKTHCPRLILKRVFDESERHWRRLRYLELPFVSNHEKGNTVVKIRSPEETIPYWTVLAAEEIDS